MADAKTPAKKRAAFTRGPQKLNLIIRVRDADGNVRTDITSASVEVEVTKDTAALVELLTGPQGAQGAVVKVIEVPIARKPEPAPGAAE